MEDLTRHPSVLTALGRTLLVAVDRDGVVREVSDNVVALVERPPQAVVGQPFAALIPDPEQRAAFRRGLERALTDDTPVRVAHDLAWGNGRRRCESVLTPYTAHGALRVHVACTDVSHMVRHIEVLETAQSLFSTVLRGAAEPIVGIDDEGRVVATSEAVAPVLGLSTQAITGRFLGDFLDVPLSRLLDTRREARIETLARRADGSRFPAVVMPGPPTGQPGGLRTVVIQDNTDQVERESRLRARADTDPLTGLANRAALMRFLDERLKEPEQVGDHLAVLLLDLDGFKAVNDTHGHAAGDQLLVSLAQRLENAVREDDLVARLGGDEFVVVMPKLTDPEQARRRGQALLDSVRAPYNLAVGLVQLTASVGLAFFPDDGEDSATLVELADAAMYRAKRTGRDRLEAVA